MDVCVDVDRSSEKAWEKAGVVAVLHYLCTKVPRYLTYRPIAGMH